MCLISEVIPLFGLGELAFFVKKPPTLIEKNTLKYKLLKTLQT